MRASRRRLQRREIANRLGFEQLSLTGIVQDSVNPRFNTIGTVDIDLGRVMGPSEAL